MKKQLTINLTFRPLTLSIWKDFEKLFGEKGACAGCWCMYWFMSKKEYDEKRKDGRTKKEMKMMVKNNIEPGILAYSGNVPVGWIAIQPREKYFRLSKSKILQPIDDKSVWSIVCFFIHKDYRKMGVSVALVKNACDFAASKGGTIVEAYPTETKTKNSAPVFIYTGTASAFRKAGFKEVARRSDTRPIMRRVIE
ncbi:MAG TPA: GNAT family N-acetyltransferase [Ignavibacteriales bacterium]|nr:GNAT family N-acetyltransferase [Ignavibacteriales bacterium]